MSQPFSPASSPLRKPLYSFNWAAGVLERCRLSHTRGYNLFLATTGLTERQLAFLVACGGPEWPALRWVLRNMDRWQGYPIDSEEKARGAIQMFSILVHNLPKSAPESMKTYLTDQASRLILEEQVKRGFRGERKRSPETSLSPADHPDHQLEFQDASFSPIPGEGASSEASAKTGSPPPQVGGDSPDKEGSCQA